MSFQHDCEVKDHLKVFIDQRRAAAIVLLRPISRGEIKEQFKCKSICFCFSNGLSSLMAAVPTANRHEIPKLKKNTVCPKHRTLFVIYSGIYYAKLQHNKIEIW